MFSEPCIDIAAITVCILIYMYLQMYRNSFGERKFKYVKMKKDLFSPERTWYSKRIMRFKSEAAKGVAARSAWNRRELDTEYRTVPRLSFKFSSCACNGMELCTY